MVALVSFTCLSRPIAPKGEGASRGTSDYRRSRLNSDPHF